MTPRTLIDRWLESLEVADSAVVLATITIRVYGGWFQERSASEERFRASSYLASQCPAIVVKRSVRASVKLVFAERLLEWPLAHASQADPSPLLFDTVGVRRRAERFSMVPGANCTQEGCELRKVHRWSKRGRACHTAGCPRDFGDCFERKEQKQVDVHLALDLVASMASGQYDEVALVSNDRDLLPALYAASTFNVSSHLSTIRGNSVVTYLDGALERRRVSIISMAAIHQQEGGASDARMD